MANKYMKKLFNFITHLGNANQKQDEIFHFSYNDCYKKEKY